MYKYPAWMTIVFLSVFLGACGGKIVSKVAPGLVSEESINQQALVAYEQVKKEATLSDDQQMVALVKRVGQRIAAASGENFDWEVQLIESDELNAWCMPGGKMAVYTGILPVLETEAALAAVMGHEVAHATARHGMRGYAEAIENQLAGAAIGIAAGVAAENLCESEGCRQLAQLGGAAGAFGLTFFQRSYSREDETESDRLGQIYMARAGYDPAAAIRVWERMEQATGGSSGPEFMSTHPANDSRQDNLRKWLPEAQAIYEQAPVKYGLGEKLF